MSLANGSASLPQKNPFNSFPSWRFKWNSRMTEFKIESPRGLILLAKNKINHTMARMWLWGITNSSTRSHKGRIKMWEYIKVISGWAELILRFIHTSILRMWCCQLLINRVTTSSNSWLFYNILTMGPSVIMLAISSVFLANSEHLINLRS